MQERLTKGLVLFGGGGVFLSCRFLIMGFVLPTLVSALQSFSSTNADEADRLSSLMKKTAAILFSSPLSVLLIWNVLKNAEGGSRSSGWCCKGLRGIGWLEMLAQKGSAMAVRQVLSSYKWVHSPEISIGKKCTCFISAKVGSECTELSEPGGEQSEGER